MVRFEELGQEEDLKEEREPTAPKAVPGFLGDRSEDASSALSAAADLPINAADSVGHHYDLRTQAADEAVNRAMDELDQISESLTVLRSTGVDASHAMPETQSFARRRLPSSALLPRNCGPGSSATIAPK